MATWRSCLHFRIKTPSAVRFSPCSSPIGRAGTFCILSSVLEQLKVEGVVDLFFFIHALRQQQPGLVATFVSHLQFYLYLLL